MTTLVGSSEEQEGNDLKGSDSEVIAFKYTGASVSNGAGNLNRSSGGGRKDGLVELSDVVASIKRSIVKVNTVDETYLGISYHIIHCALNSPGHKPLEEQSSRRMLRLVRTNKHISTTIASTFMLMHIVHRYLETCEEANRSLRSIELKNPLSDSINNGRTQGLASYNFHCCYNGSMDIKFIESCYYRCSK